MIYYYYIYHLGYLQKIDWFSFVIILIFHNIQSVTRFQRSKFCLASVVCCLIRWRRNIPQCKSLSVAPACWGSWFLIGFGSHLREMATRCPPTCRHLRLPLAPAFPWHFPLGSNPVFWSGQGGLLLSLTLDTWLITVVLKKTYFLFQRYNFFKDPNWSWWIVTRVYPICTFFTSPRRHLIVIFRFSCRVRVLFCIF